MRQKKIMAVASAGGHWVQLLRMYPAFRHHKVFWVSTMVELSDKIPAGRFCCVRDASMWDKLGLFVMAVQVFWCVMRIRPDVVLSTGAAPGFFAVVFGHIVGAKTIWIDSIANAEELSLAGKKVRRWADCWVTQWPELSSDDGPMYIGSII